LNSKIEFKEKFLQNDLSKTLEQEKNEYKEIQKNYHTMLSNETKDSIGIITNFSPQTGPGRYAYQLFREIKKTKKTDLVLCTESPEKEYDPEICVVFGKKYPLFSKTLNAYYIYPKKIPEFKLYHATNHFLGRIAETKKPCIVSILDLYFTESNKHSPFFSRLLAKKAIEHAKKAEAIITLSETAKKQICEKIGLHEDKVFVTYMGVDFVKFKPYNKEFSRKKTSLPLDKKIILYVGSEREVRENSENVVKSFHEVHKKQKDILLVKIGKKSSHITVLIKQLELEKNIVRIERAPEKLLQYYYASADVFLGLDMESGYSLAVLESMACGTPVLCSDREQFNEIIGSKGMTADPLNPTDISAKLLRLLEEPEKLAKMSKCGLELVRQYSWNKTAMQTLKVYDKVGE